VTLLDDTLATIHPASDEALAAAEARQLRLTKPAGSLGRLEEIGNRLAAVADQCPPPYPQRAVIGLFAGDHGVCAQGVSPWPQEVTLQMALNIASGGAAINAIARQVGAEVWVTDVGVAAEVPEHSAVRARKVRAGTRDFAVEPALTRDEARAALEVGIEAADEAVDGGAEILLTGEMGIGNTTPASALISVFTGVDVPTVTGRGAGAGDDMLTRKIAVIEGALRLHRPDPADPLGVLAAVGGLEHAALAGFILGAAARRVPVIVDGVIAASAACVAVGLSDDVRGYLISGHAGVEPGIRAALAWLDLQPLVDLDLRLGEGTGAALALPAVQASARILNEMATFDSAGVVEG
jgi:nicotinate-nucleotide--dimethylbenzimidazole phosphoribosyltransferase